MWTRLELLKTCLELQAESGKEKEQINPDLHLLLAQMQITYKFKLEIVEQDNGNIYITKGVSTLYPCIIAHSDDVATYNLNKAIIHFKGADWIKACDKSTGEPHDTGGDDKCGIWAGMQMLIDLPVAKFVIVVSEENGCHGSKAANMEFFKDCMFVAQFDRNHSKNDFINYTNGIDVCSKEFEEYVKPYIDKYDYAFASGSITDVGALRKNGLEISSFNISAGYFKPHSDNSYVVPSKLFKSYNLVIELFNNSTKQFCFPVPPPKIWENQNSFKNSEEFFLSALSKKITNLYNKENKVLREHKIPSIFKWLVEMLDCVDNINASMPDYTPITDTLHEFFLEKEEEQIAENLDKEYKKLSGKCKNPLLCKELRITDKDAIGGAVDMCVNCSQTFELPSKNSNFGQYSFSEFDDKWD